MVMRWDVDYIYLDQFNLLKPTCYVKHQQV
jgi:hypothetical protein